MLDPQVIDALRQLNQDGEPDLLREVLTVFLDDAPQRVRAMAEAVASGDARALERSAHALKGAAGSIGAHALQHLCRDLEQMGRKGDTSTAAAHFEAFRAEFARVRQAIEQLL